MDTDHRSDGDIAGTTSSDGDPTDTTGSDGDTAAGRAPSEPPPEPPAVPARVRNIRLATWRGVLIRSGRGFLNDNCVDWAAALTYFGLLALFPSAIVVFAIVGLVAATPTAADTIMDLIGELVPDPVMADLQQPVREAITQQAPSGFLLSFGLLGAIWAASAYLRSFSRAANNIYEVQEGRKAYRLIPLQLGLTVVALILLSVVVIAMVLSGPVASAVGETFGVADTALRVWDIGKWPILVLIVGILLSLLFWVAPNVRQPRFRWLTVGGAVALVTWVIGSAGFGLYVANFGAYDVTYGSLGAVIVFLVWLFVSNCAILFGVEINAELQRGRQLQAGREIDPDAPPLPPKKELA